MNGLLNLEQLFACIFVASAIHRGPRVLESIEGL